MAGHIIFVRFFFGYSTSFPFERFVHLKDGGIEDTVEALRKEWWSKPTNRGLLKKSRNKLRDRQRAWLKGTLAAPETSRILPAVASRITDPPTPTGTPTFEEIAVVAEWWNSTTCGDWPHGISPRYPMKRFDAKELANDAAAAIQKKVTEVTQAVYAKVNWSDVDAILASGNPRFTVVAEGELPRPELAAAGEKICRLCDPTGQHQLLEEALLRSYLPFIRPTLEQFDTLSEADDTGQVPWPLGMHADLVLRMVKRANVEVSFESKVVAWNALRKLAEAYPEKVSNEVLRQDEGAGSENVHKTIADLRHLISRLGLTIPRATANGYSLAESSANLT